MAGSRRNPMVVTHEGGLKFAAQIGRHRLIVDQPEYTGGEDAGPAPIQLLGASLGTCVALYVQQFCQARNLPCDGMRVELLQHGAQHPNRIGQFSVRVVLPEALPPQYAEMLERVARSCPAHNTLAHGAGIELEIAVEAEASV